MYNPPPRRSAPVIEPVSSPVPDAMFTGPRYNPLVRYAITVVAYIVFASIFGHVPSLFSSNDFIGRWLSETLMAVPAIWTLTHPRFFPKPWTPEISRGRAVLIAYIILVALAAYGRVGSNSLSLIFFYLVVQIINGIRGWVFLFKTMRAKK